MSENLFVKNIQNQALTPELESFLLYSEKRRGHIFDPPFELTINDNGRMALAQQFNISFEDTKNTVKIDGYWGFSQENLYLSYKKRFFTLPKTAALSIKNAIIKQYLSALDFSKINIENWKPFEHQKQAVAFMLFAKRCFLLDDQGLGKTDSAIMAHIMSGVKQTLVCTLSALPLNWKREISKYGLSARIIKDSKDHLDYNEDFLIVSHDKLRLLISNNKQLFVNANMIIVDECHRFKTLTSARSKALKKIIASPSVEYVFGLSGTLVENNEDFYGVCDSLGINVDGMIGDDSTQYITKRNLHHDFLLRYCNKMRIDAKMSDEHYNSYRKNCPAFSSFLVLRGEHKRAIHRYEALQKSKFFKNKKDLKTFKTYNQFSDYVYESIRKHPDVEYQVKHFYIYVDDNRNSNSEELSARKELYVLRRMKNEVLKDFVKKERDYIYLELSPIEKKKYQALYKELGIKDENKLSADDFSKIQNMSQGIALRQFLAIKKVEHTARYVSERIEDDNKIILFTNFIEEYEFFKKQFDEKEAIFIDSSFSVTKKQELIDKFNKNESYKVLVGNLIPLGTGHNITSANEVVFNSLSWTAKDLLQGEDRSWRLGQKRDVNVSYMVFDETIELAVLDRVFSKMQNSDVFNEF